jgi:hypothetical protein
MTITVTHSTLADGSFSASGATAWDANHTLVGLGTMAEQDANNVNITGGTITGVAVTASPAGSNTQVQYNNAGVLAGNANFTYTGNDVNVPFGPSNSATPISRVALALSMMT